MRWGFCFLFVVGIWKGFVSTGVPLHVSLGGLIWKSLP